MILNILSCDVRGAMLIGLESRADTPGGRTLNAMQWVAALKSHNDLLSAAVCVDRNET